MAQSRAGVGRRAVPPSTVQDGGPVLRVELLGGFRVTVGGVVVVPEAWRRRKATHLVKLLALAPGHALHREELLDALWPDLDPDAAANNLRQALHAARAALATAAPGAGEALRLEGERLTLRPPIPLEVDVAEFEAAAAAARRSGDPAAYEAAIARYRGDLLPEDRYEDWAAPRREALRGTWVGLLGELARHSEAAGRPVEAVAALERLAAAEPADEGAHAGLMRLFARQGQRERALRQYALLREALRRELDAEPEPATQRLYAQILAGQGGPASARPARELDQSQHAPAAAPTVPPRPRPAHNLPVALTSFVGREQEVAELAGRLAAVDVGRLLSLIGPGGVGKTRLALAAAAEVVAAMPDGVWLVELAGLVAPDLVPEAVARVLGVREEPGRPLTDVLADALGARRLLLVLDNCEHLVDACAALAEGLLATCPAVRILATSREALRVPGEMIWPVPPLALPGPEDEHLSTRLATVAAPRLFLERARLASPRFALTADNAGAVATICRRLAGLPLALELAAGRVGLLTPEQLAVRLDDALRLLTGGARTAPGRQRTLRATLDWSYDLLDEAERALLRRLSVFAGGWTIEAAEAVCGERGRGNADQGPGDGTGEAGAGADSAPADGPLPHSPFRVPRSDVLALLASLVDKSWVRVEEGAEEARYRLLEPVRQYALGRLAEAREAAQIRSRHAAHYTTLVEGVDDRLIGPAQARWLDRLEWEHDNLRVTLTWLAEGGDPTPGLRLAAELWRFWHLRGHLREGRRWLDTFLAAADPAPSPSLPRVRALFAAARLAIHAGDHAAARPRLAECLAGARMLGEDEWAAAALTLLGHMAMREGDYDRARGPYEEALALGQALGLWHGVGLSFGSLGQLALARDDYVAARPLLERALALLEGAGDQYGVADVHIRFGDIALGEGDLVAARRHYTASLTRYHRLGQRYGVAHALEGLALATEGADGEVAARLLAVAAATIEELGLPPLPARGSRLRTRLDEARRAAAAAHPLAWEAGRALSLDEAVAEALANVADAMEAR